MSSAGRSSPSVDHQDRSGAALLDRAGNPVPADHNWIVIDNRTKQVVFTDRTCRGARSWATGVAGYPTSRVRAGLYVAACRQGNLTVTTRNDPFLDAMHSED